MSPFKKYRHILLNENYGVAESLQQFVLSLYNSASTKFAADRLASYDQKHLEIFFELAQSYNRNGESDPEFMQLCQDMRELRYSWGLKHLRAVEAHKAIDPKNYDDGEREWHVEMRWLNERTEAYRAKGWIRD